MVRNPSFQTDFSRYAQGPNHYLSQLAACHTHTTKGNAFDKLTSVMLTVDLSSLEVFKQVSLSRQ